MALDLWQLRRQKRMTIDELARTAGVHPALIKAYELGERAIPERDLERLAAALEVEVEDIKELSDPPPRGPSRPSAAAPAEGDAPRPRYDNSSRYDSGSPRYDSGSRYSNDYGRSSYGGRSESSRPGYGEGRPSYGEGRPSYGESRPGYGEGRSGYGEGRPSYGEGRSGYSGGDYNRGYDRPAPRYDSDRGPARGPRPPYRPDRPDRMERRPERPPKKPGGLKRRPQVAPARPSQLEHLKILLQQLDMSGDDLLRLAGKPLSMLNRREASHLLTTCQEMIAERKPERPKGKRQRPYLPESVDEHELVYLTQVQLDGNPMHLTLFNGTTLQGVLRGFSPYALTLAINGGDEVTVQKLAIAFYQVTPAPAKPAVKEASAEEEGES
jgi:transcriptional regulator with XRE-family HTH domain/sRNA-binding regulator protein Hfq